ncbi:hypothetical protein Tco_0804883 [Tanacetum coccineum]
MTRCTEVKSSSMNLKEMDFNETPSVQHKRIILRIPYVVIIVQIGVVGISHKRRLTSRWIMKLLGECAYESYGDDDESTGGGSDDGSDTQ